MLDHGSTADLVGAGLYAVPVDGRWLLHSPSTGASALVNAAAVRKLVGGTAPSELGLAALMESAPAEPRGPAECGYRPAFLGLIPTRGCNLGCLYCGFRAGALAKQEMPPELAVSAIEWFAADRVRSGDEMLDVHLFGGEPFVARDLVDVIVHRTRAVAARDGLVPHLEAATNGAYPAELARFIGDYFDHVVLSLDGPPECHDRHRCRPDGSPTYEIVAGTAKILSDSPCGFILRVCVSNENVDRMADTVRWFCERFEPSSIHFEPLQPTSDSAEAGLFPPDAVQFAKGFLEARAEGEQRGIEVLFSGTMLGRRDGFCPAQNDGLIVSPDGRISNCYLLEADWKQRGLDLNIGEVSTEGLVRIEPEAIERVRGVAQLPARCNRCFCQASCRGGCRVNHSYPGAGEAYDDLCLETRLITASALLQQLGATELSRDLVDRQELRQALAAHPSDRLCDWRAPA